MVSKAHHDPDRWRRVEALFDRVVDADEAKRERILCDVDPIVAAEVRSLLNAHAASAGFLEQPVDGPRVGPYRIVEQIGRGGMGTVYEARRTRPSRTVALKVLNNPTLPSEDDLARFEREAEVLARLQHPGIATLYETGRSPHGIDYIAMELVRGPSLREWVRESEPSRQRLLELFASLCSTLAYAHEHGVTHRDLKPGNIVVHDEGATPRVKVLDFGLARIRDPRGRGEASLTAPGSIVGTLSYASPEQASGRVDEVDSRSDVYSLGVILYELLTGRLPYDTTLGSLFEGVRVVCEATPPSPKSLDALLRGDLETILTKALEKRPERRYADAGELGDDVRRYLAQRPIQARAPSRLYQLGRLVARHRRAFAFALSLFLLVTSAAVGMTLLYLDARSAERRVSEEARTTRAVNDFLRRTLSLANPAVSGVSDLSMKELLDRAAERIDRELPRNTRVAAEVRSAVGEAYAGLGEYALAEVHLRRALSTRRAVLAPDHPELAQGLLELGTLLLERGEYAAARTQLEDADTILLGHPPGALRARVLMRLAGCTRVAGSAPGRFEDAERLYREALAMLESGEHDGALRAELRCELGALLGTMGRPDETARLYDGALADYRAERGADSVEYGLCLNSLAVTLGRQRRGDEALETYRRALEILEPGLGAEHPDLAVVLDNYGDQLTRNRRPSEGEPHLRRALRLRSAHLRPDHPELAVTLNHLGQCLQSQGRLDDAREAFESALALNVAHYGEDSTEVANGEANLAVLLLRRGDAQGAEALARSALGRYRASLPEQHWWTAGCRSLLARCLMERQAYDEAETLLIDAIGVLDETRGRADRDTRGARQRLLELYGRLGRTDDAARLERELAE